MSNGVLEQCFEAIEQFKKETEWKPMKTVFARVNGRGVCIDFTHEQLKELETVENLVHTLKTMYMSDDVIFEGFGEF